MSLMGHPTASVLTCDQALFLFFSSPKRKGKRDCLIAGLLSARWKTKQKSLEFIQYSVTIILLLFALHDNQCNLHKETDCIRLPGTWKRVFVFGYVHIIQDSFSSRHETELSDMRFSALEIGAAQLRSVIEIALKSPFLCEIRSLKFRAGAKAIRNTGAPNEDIVQNRLT